MCFFPVLSGKFPKKNLLTTWEMHTKKVVERGIFSRNLPKKHL